MYHQDLVEMSNFNETFKLQVFREKNMKILKYLKQEEDISFTGKEK